MASDHPPVRLSIPHDEVVVLSDLLSRWERDGTADSLPFEDQAEQRVLWNLTARLEPLVDDVFSANHEHVVAASRAAVRDVVE